MKRKGEMLKAIGMELIMRKHEITDKVDTIYFGGGTPSLMTRSEIGSLLTLIDDNYRLSDHPEITLEANPDDLSMLKISELSASGVNRLSIGVQSFFDEDLLYMNRAHDAKEAHNALEWATAEFDNLSIDLIYGLPGLSDERWMQNLNKTFDLGIQHISSYALTVEPKTALDHFIKNGSYAAPKEAQTERHFNLLQQATSSRGYVQYEISNFGREGFFSRHNTSYWNGIPYLGVGPSAHSFDGNTRSWNIANNAKYISAINKKLFPSEHELLSPEDRINESIMTGLRTIWGVSLEQIEIQFGEKYKKEILDQAEDHLKQGRLYTKAERIYLKPEYYFLADGISADLFLLKV
jgi:oxygen-independent coproporphyrinogen-3 oxidase